MRFIKEFLTEQGFTAEFVIIREIKFNPKSESATVLLDLYKSEEDYEDGKVKCKSLGVVISDQAYSNFVSTSGLYNKASVFLKSEGQILEGALDA